MIAIKEAFSILFSLAIIGLIVWELWKNKSNLNYVWKIYFQSGILTYVRALGIAAITLTTFATVAPLVPPFLHWGWANVVFGNSGNLIFQPFETLKKVRPSPGGDVLLQSFDTTTTLSASQIATFDYSIILIFLLWLFLILSVPFWANLEEKIFRKGGNSWKQIMIRSTLFGLVHISVGIPIFAGFVLIIPGFLFACRYKYVHDRYLKKTHNETMAQDAGVEASTADHAVYNAILITLFVAVMVLLD